MNSENNFVKLGQIVKINKVLKQYRGKKLEKTDRNLIKGIFKNRPHKPFNDDEEADEDRSEKGAGKSIKMLTPNNVETEAV